MGFAGKGYLRSFNTKPAIDNTDDKVEEWAPCCSNSINHDVIGSSFELELLVPDAALMDNDSEAYSPCSFLASQA